jgi:hypothetical protein
MFTLLLGIAIGLIVGWNFLQQPIWAAKMVHDVKAKLGMNDNSIPPSVN